MNLEFEYIYIYSFIGYYGNKVISLGEVEVSHRQSWALSVFFNFSIIKNYLFAFFIKLITYFCISPI